MEEPFMNRLLLKQVRVAVLLPTEAEEEFEWGAVLDCGALGPSQEEPSLFYQDADDWDERPAHCAGD
jgi:hypothetical protein